MVFTKGAEEDPLGSMGCSSLNKFPEPTKHHSFGDDICYRRSLYSNAANNISISSKRPRSDRRRDPDKYRLTYCMNPQSSITVGILATKTGQPFLKRLTLFLSMCYDEHFKDPARGYILKPKSPPYQAGFLIEKQLYSAGATGVGHSHI